MSAKKIKARVMYEWPSGGRISEERDYDGGSETPVFILPATREAYEQMVEQISKAMCGEVNHGQFSWTMKHMRPEVVRGFAVAALKALNLKEPKP